MIFAGQENPFIIFRSKEMYIYFKTNNKIPINLLKNKKKKQGFWSFFFLEGTLTVFLFPKILVLLCVVHLKEMKMISEN